MERQGHGFIYQQIIIENNNLIASINYTDKWDAYEEKIPASIKCIGVKGSIDFGDFKRQSNVDTDFILYVGFWSGKKDNIVEEYKILIFKEKWNSYFGDTTIINNMLSEMKLITNDKSDDGKWKIFRNKYKDLYGKSTVSLRFKRDHKAQKRIQCGITKKNFLDIVLKDGIIL